MDYRYIKAFMHTAQHSSFSKAAEVLGIAQSAVSRQIKLLEESLDEELIIRSSKKVLLTAKGNELYLAAINFDKLALNIFEKEDKRPLKIGLLHGLLTSWFLPLLTSFYQEHKRNITVDVLLPNELKVGLGEGKFDIIFTTENVQSELITSLKLFDEEVVVISKDEIDIKNLQQYRWITYSDEDFMYRASSEKSKSILRISSITSVIELVMSGIGIAAVPSHTLKGKTELKTQHLKEFDGAQIYMATLNYKSMPQHIGEFTKLIRDREVT